MCTHFMCVARRVQRHLVAHAWASCAMHAGKGTGYRYFGAAKNLPGVKELFEVEAPKQVGW